MTGAAAEAVAVTLLIASLVFALTRPRGASEAVVAVPSAGLVLALGIVPLDDAGDVVRRIGPSVAFLAAVLVFAHLCADAGVFDYLGRRAARASRGDPHRLLGWVIGLAAAVTATLTLDATVVLLTPVVLATARRLRVPPRPHTFASARLANSGSLLMPVSNLTNLIAFGSTGLSFGRFTALMTLPWLAVGGAEWVTLRAAFRRDLRSVGEPTPPVGTRAPRYAMSVLAATVLLFVVASSLGVAPAWAALLGCVALLAPRLGRRDVTVSRLIAEASPGFCAFVFALAVIVDGVARHGLGDLLDRVTPAGDSLPQLLAVAGIAAALANVVNNLPATLAIVPVVSGSPAAALAVLLGVNIGPNATYPGSLATLLWRRRLPREARPTTGQFHALGLLTVPVLLVIATIALWAGIRVVGV